jgi:hypothetical protein
VSYSICVGIMQVGFRVVFQNPDNVLSSILPEVYLLCIGAVVAEGLLRGSVNLSSPPRNLHYHSESLSLCLFEKRFQINPQCFKHFQQNVILIFEVLEYDFNLLLSFHVDLEIVFGPLFSMMTLDILTHHNKRHQEKLNKIGNKKPKYKPHRRIELHILRGKQIPAQPQDRPYGDEEKKSHCAICSVIKIANLSNRVLFSESSLFMSRNGGRLALNSVRESGFNVLISISVALSYTYTLQTTRVPHPRQRGVGRRGT